MESIIKFLEHKAYLLRYLSILSTTKAGSGHPTSCLSAADLVAVLFFYAMNFDPKNPNNLNNDHFILSKGHAAPLLYAVWQQLDILSENELLNLRKFNSVLEGHPSTRFNRIEAATGSLGQGLSISTGIALSAKLDQRDFYSYCLMGDSEVAEGQIWEACEIASYYKLNNLIAILDVNGLGQTGPTMLKHDTDKYVKKFNSFGFNTIVIDGHNIVEIIKAFDESKTFNNQKPTIIIAKTIKGYGIETVENKNGFHGKVFSNEQLPEILNELKRKFPTAQTSNDYKWVAKIPKSENEKIEKNLNFKIQNANFEIGQKIATRKAYGLALANLDDICKNLLVLDAEVQNSTYSEILQKKDPKKFIECFIAEQNMISMAVGLTTQEKITFSSTFACFLTRAFDQLRMAAISRSPLRICGSHAGVSIGQDGPSQMGLEDIAMFRTLPKSIIFYPADGVSTFKLVELMSNYKEGISYLRTTRSETNILYNNDEIFKIGGCKVLRKSENDKVCVIAAGITLFEALKAYEELKKENILISVIDLYSIKPLDTTTVIDVAKKSNNKIITIEDHYLEGGLGQAVNFEVKNSGIYIENLAVEKIPCSGEPNELLEFESINYKAIITKVKLVLA